MSNRSRRGACLAILLAVANAVSAQTILIVTRETSDGEPVPRPFFSQEGFMSAMFDFGLVSFDTGPYEPQIDWENGRYGEPLEIAAAGLADYLVVARVDSRVAEAPGVTGGSGQPPEVASRVRFELLEVSGGKSLGRGEISLSSAQAESDQPSSDDQPLGYGQPLGYRQPLGYGQAMFRAGEALARECLRLLTGAGERRSVPGSSSAGG